MMSDTAAEASQLLNRIIHCVSLRNTVLKHHDRVRVWQSAHRYGFTDLCEERPKSEKV